MEIPPDVCFFVECLLKIARSLHHSGILSAIIIALQKSFGGFMSTRFPILLFVLFAVFLLFTCTDSTFADSDLIVTTDLMKIKQIPTVTVSPDGKTIAYVVKGIEKAEPESSEANKEGSNESKRKS